MYHNYGFSRPPNHEPWVKKQHPSKYRQDVRICLFKRFSLFFFYCYCYKLFCFAAKCFNFFMFQVISLLTLKNLFVFLPLQHYGSSLLSTSYYTASLNFVLNIESRMVNFLEIQIPTKLTKIANSSRIWTKKIMPILHRKVRVVRSKSMKLTDVFRDKAIHELVSVLKCR